MKRQEMVVLRAKRGLTQKETAKLLGVNACTLNFVENGKRHGTPEFWQKYKDLFNLDGEQIWNIQNNIYEY